MKIDEYEKKVLQHLGMPGTNGKTFSLIMIQVGMEKMPLINMLYKLQNLGLATYRIRGNKNHWYVTSKGMQQLV